MRGSRLFLRSLNSIFGMIVPPSYGTTVTLHSGPSIQTAIDRATVGDEIVLENGTYEGGFSFRGKGVTLRSNDPDDSSVIAQTVINETGFDSIITFDSGEGLNSILAGLNVTGAMKGGGGISLTGSSHPSMDNCVFHHNQSLTDGGGINIGETSSVNLLRCTFEKNTAGCGGGVLSAGGGSQFKNCIFYDHVAGLGTSVHCKKDSGSNFWNCIFASNPGITLTLTPAPTIPGDVTEDKEVNAADVMKILSACHEEIGSASSEDLNHDGGLDLEDLVILQEHWHEVTEP